MKTPNEMKLDQGGMTPVGKSIDQPEAPNALSMALKQRRINKAQKHRMVAPGSPDDDPSSITNPDPTQE